MTLFSSDQLKCSLIQDHSNNDSISYVLTREDGTEVDEIDIGQKDWMYSYPKDKKFFTWKFLDHTPDMRARVQRRAFQEAFNSVEKLTDITIDYEKDVNKKTDVTVEWLEDIEKFNNKKSVLAHAWLYYPKGRKNGRIEFNDSPDSKFYFTPLGWPVPAYLVDNVNFKKGDLDPGGNILTRMSQSTVKIAMHEFGHVLGLKHDIIHRASMMYPSISLSYHKYKIQKQTFYWDSETSIPRLTQRYGSSYIWSRWLDRWRGRRTRKSTYMRYA